MNFFITISVIAALRLLNDYLKEDTEKTSQLVNSKKTVSGSILTNSYDVLGLAYSQPINVDIINSAYNKRLQLFTNGNENIPIYSRQEVTAAKVCLMDFCKYTGTWS